MAGESRQAGYWGQSWNPTTQGMPFWTGTSVLTWEAAEPRGRAQAMTTSSSRVASRVRDPARFSLPPKMTEGSFSGGSGVKNLPANAGNVDSIPGLGRSHMLWGNPARVPQLLSRCSRAWKLQLESSLCLLKLHESARSNEDLAQPKISKIRGTVVGPTPPGVVRVKLDNCSAQQLTRQQYLVNINSDATGNFPSV